MASVEVVVIGITKDGVRLGIIAPKEVEVHRREVFEAIAAANRAATAPAQGVPRPIQDAAALFRARLPKPHGDQAAHGSALTPASCRPAQREILSQVRDRGRQPEGLSPRLFR